MTYNLHPIFVHFPIALLSLYSVLAILPFRKWFPRVNWRDILFVLLVTGFFGAYLSSVTGEVAEHIVRVDRSILNAHTFFAAASMWFYGLLFLGEALRVLDQKIKKITIISFAFTFIDKVRNILQNRVIIFLLAIFGFISIFITGLLGGVMVYGTSADPLAPVVLRLLGISI